MSVPRNPQAEALAGKLAGRHPSARDWHISIPGGVFTAVSLEPGTSWDCQRQDLTALVHALAEDWFIVEIPSPIRGEPPVDFVSVCDLPSAVKVWTQAYAKRLNEQH